MNSSFSRIKLQTSVLAIAFGIFGVTYLLKDDQFINHFISISGLILAGIAYLYALRQLKSNIALTSGYILLMAFVIRIGAIPIPIFIDDLLYRALWDGWLQSNALNPYLYLPSSEQLELLKSNDLRDLVFRENDYTSYSPLYEVFFRYTGWLYDHFGLAYAILWQKGVSIAIDLATIYSLVMLTEQTDKPIRYVAGFAWNPFLILFITSQGLIVQIGALAIIWFLYLIYSKNYMLANLLWGMVMLATPAGWLGLPILAFGFYQGLKRWYFIGLSTFTYVVWWIPFFKLEAIQHYLLGLATYWSDGFSHLSAGYFIVNLLPTESVYKSLIWLVALILCYLFVIMYIWLKKSPLNEKQVSHYLMVFCLAYFLFSPVIFLSVVPVLFVLSCYNGTYNGILALFSTLLLLNFGFLQYSAFLPAILFGLGLIAIILSWFNREKIEWVNQFID